MLCRYSCLCFLFFFVSYRTWKKKLNSRLFFEQAALALCSPQGGHCLLVLVSNRNRQLKQRHFWAKNINQKWGHFPDNMPWCYQICIGKCLYPCRDDFAEYYSSVIKSKMAGTSFRLPIICLHCRLINKVHFRLTCVAQKHLCLRSLICLQNVLDDLFQLLSIGLVRLKKVLGLPTYSGWPGRPFLKPFTPVVEVFHSLKLNSYQIIFNQANASSRFHASLRKQLTFHDAVTGLLHEMTSEKRVEIQYWWHVTT